MSSIPNQNSRVLRFRVVGDPKPQPRQRHKIIAAKGKKPFVMNYTPHDSAISSWKQTVQDSVRRELTDDFVMLDSPLALQAVFLMERPKCLLKKSSDTSRIYYACTPDTDNLIKAVKDCLQSIVWKNDSIICLETVSKYYRALDEEPGMILSVMMLD